MKTAKEKVQAALGRDEWKSICQIFGEDGHEQRAEIALAVEEGIEDGWIDWRIRKRREFRLSGHSLGSNNTTKTTMR